VNSFLLDTNICIYLIKKKPEHLLHRIKKYEHLISGISSITLSELEYGVQKSDYIEQNTLSLLRFLVQFNVVAFDEAAAHEYGLIRASLEKRGRVIGNMDMLIGAHARSLGCILVTNNEKEFKRIEGLNVENWTKQ
jgi:tRNA(fMet)-specific endonuclease VapC